MENKSVPEGEKWRTRLAPTPSGFLHLGNIYSFAITAAIAEVIRAGVLLRIDDLDATRSRPDYVRDIFDTLSFLDIQWDNGPRSPEAFKSDFSQLTRSHLYDHALKQLSLSGLVFACTCTRSDLAVNGDKGYPGTCRHKKIPLDTPGVSWRMLTPANLEVKVRTPGGFEQMKFPAEMTDFVVRKKDGAAAYQLSSVVDDVFFGINFVVRGRDLLASTLAQLYLAEILDQRGFSDTVFYHHRLFYTQSGEKLSKSEGHTSIQFLRKEGATADQVYGMVGERAGVPDLHHWRDLCGYVKQLFENVHAGRKL